MSQRSEQDVSSEAMGLEALAQNRMARDRELRAMAPPMDWEAIASEGAERLAVDWNNTKGKTLNTARSRSQLTKAFRRKCHLQEFD